MKVCFKCGTEKPYSEFYKHKAMGDGYLGKCKACTKVDVKERYYAKHDEVLAYEKKRANLPHRVELRKAYAQTPEGKASGNKAKRKYSQENPVKRAAHIILGNAVRGGRVIKPSACQSCGKGGRIHGHHHDYAKPLDVQWVCTGCHAAIHKDLAAITPL